MREIFICGQKLLVTDEEGNLIGSDQNLISRHWTPKPGDVCVDAGFGPGTWTLIALARGATTFSFDPKENATDILKRHIELNGFKLATVIQMGLWNAAAMLPFGANGFKEKEMSFERPCTTLDLHFSEHPVERVDYINMDVEGSEMNVLFGARKTLRRHLPKLIIEVHDMAEWDGLEEEIAAAGPYTFLRENNFLIAEPRKKGD